MSKTSPTPPNVRTEAVRILERVLSDDAYANRTLDAALSSHKWDPRDAGLLTELVYGVLRRLYPLDAMIDSLSSRKLDSIDPFVLMHLRLAFYQMHFLDRIPDHAVLSEAVRLVKRKCGKGTGGFVNAILRKCQRDSLTPVSLPTLDNPVQQLARDTSHPSWFVQRMLDLHGNERATAILEQNNTPAPLTLRVNPGWGKRDTLLQQLAQDEGDVEATPFSPDGIHLTTSQSNALQTLRKRLPNAFVVQDEAAQLLGHWLNPQAGESILDACAAPGGKTTHLAALAPEASITALDVHKHKMALIQQACKRLQLTNVHTRLHDATQPLGETYDRILCDAPCSGLGIIRRQPEIRYRRNAKDLQRLHTLQLDLLRNLIKALKPGGILLFSVCTQTPEENDQLVDEFLQEHPECQLVPPPSTGDIDWSTFVDERHLFRTHPVTHQMDGFFAFCVTKSK